MKNQRKTREEIQRNKINRNVFAFNKNSFATDFSNDKTGIMMIQLTAKGPPGRSRSPGLSMLR